MENCGIGDSGGGTGYLVEVGGLSENEIRISIKWYIPNLTTMANGLSSFNDILSL